VSLGSEDGVGADLAVKGRGGRRVIHFICVC
jgi:hypothetical protein